MNKFSRTYKNLQNPMPPYPMYGLGELVCYGGYRYEITDLKPNEDEGCWMYDLKRVDGSEETEGGIFEPGLTKSYVNKSATVEKPGTASHTPKWDRCVAQVKENGGADPYAVCTAMLGEESFKSMSDDDFDDTMKMYMRKLGISAAGPVPNSLLADQDLSGETMKSVFAKSDLMSFSVWYYDPLNARKCAVFNNIIDAEAFARVVEQMGFKDISIVKAAPETPADGNLIQNIKNAQIKRQKATIIARDESASKSFIDFWKNGSK